MAACNISGIKCILCADPVFPSDETTELGTVIISLNPGSNQGLEKKFSFDFFKRFFRCSTDNQF